MAPTPPQSTVKTWRFRVNVDCDDATDELHRATLLLEIKESLLGNGSGWTDRSGSSVVIADHWTVRASSNGVTASASDLWVDTGDLVWATSPTARSWIVFRHRNYFDIDDGLDLLIECSEASSTTRNATIGLYVSRDGFDITSPTTTARPTATDEVEVLDANGGMTTSAWCGSDTNDGDHATGTLHFMMSDDGLSVRVAICRLGACIAFWDLFRMEEWTDTPQTHPFAMMVASSDTDAAQTLWTDFRDINDNCQWYTRDDTIGGLCRMRAQMPYSTAGTVIASSLAACNFGGLAVDPFICIALCGASVVTGTTIVALPDMWWGRQASDLESFPDDGSRQFVQFGALIIPWNGTVMVSS